MGRDPSVYPPHHTLDDGSVNIAKTLYKKKPLSEEQQSFYNQLSAAQQSAIKQKVLQLRQMRPKARLLSSWLENNLTPELPDVVAILREIDRKKSELDPKERVKRPLDSFAERILSQHGEDGITYELLQRAGMQTRTCVELGCGLNGGNAGFLVVGLQFRGLLIDGNQDYADILRATLARSPYGPVDGAVVQCGWITRERINRDIESAGFSGEIDYLGIDIDGMDWWIWDAIEVVEPRIVCIEFNSLFGETEAVTVPYRQDFFRNERVQKKRLNPKGFYGASLAALERLGRRKNCRLVATAPGSSNAYFVRNDLAPDIPAISVRDAYRKPYKERWEELRQKFLEKGLWEAAKLHNAQLVEILPDGRPAQSA